MMNDINFGRRFLSFSEGKVTHTGTSITERARPGEDESAFVTRLLDNYGSREGTIEIVFKAGQPDYAIITFRQVD